MVISGTVSTTEPRNQADTWPKESRTSVETIRSFLDIITLIMTNIAVRSRYHFDLQQASIFYLRERSITSKKGQHIQF